MKLILELLGYTLLGAVVIAAVVALTPYAPHIIFAGLCCLVGVMMAGQGSRP